MYTLKFHDIIYVLHAFQKKSKKGIATAHSDIALVRSRLKLAEENYRLRQTGEGHEQMRKKVRAAKGRKKKNENTLVEEGSGNVFADLGFPDAEERLFKAQLTFEIAQLIKKKGMTQAEVARRTGLDQPKVSRLLNGRLPGFSLDRLIAILNRLGHRVEVRISVKERAPEKSRTRVMVDKRKLSSRSGATAR